MRLVFGIVLALLVLSSQAYALGVVTDYNSDIVYISYSQKIGYYNFRVQNNAGEPEDVGIHITIESDGNIASIEKDYIIAKFGYSIPVTIKIELPEKPEKEYEVEYMLKVKSSENGQVRFSQGISKKFKVVVYGIPAEKYSGSSGSYTGTTTTEPDLPEDAVKLSEQEPEEKIISINREKAVFPEAEEESGDFPSIWIAVLGTIGIGAILAVKFGLFESIVDVIEGF